MFNGDIIHNNSNIERFGNNGLLIKSIEFSGSYKCKCKVKNGNHYTITDVKVVQCSSYKWIDQIGVSFILAVSLVVIIGFMCSYKKPLLSLFHR